MPTTRSSASAPTSQERKDATAAPARPLGLDAVLALGLSLGWFLLCGTVQLYLLTPWLPVAIAVLLLDALVVVGVTRTLGILYAVPVGVASVVAIDWFLIPPTHRTVLPGPENALGLGTYLLAGTLLGGLAAVTTRRASASEAARAALAEEHAALRRVATLVALQTPPHELFAAVCQEARDLLQVDMASMVRYEPDGVATVVAGASLEGDHIPIDTKLTLEGNTVTGLVKATGRPARIDNYAAAVGSVAGRLRENGVHSTVGSPITVNDRVWGLLVAVSKDPAPLPPATETHVSEFTELVSAAIANAENQSELRASRARIVTKGDETRRQLERDLHDGVQQRLVSLALNLRVATTVIKRELPAAEAPLSEVQRELAGVVEDLRELSRGIHPAILSGGGLRPALATLSRRVPVPVELEVQKDLELPESLEVGAYYVVAEALTNVVKHAQASFVRIEVEIKDGALILLVSDDGVGGATTTHGSGLVGLGDRAAALGGHLAWSSPPGGGTTIEAILPLAQPD